jgi:hypothetical protein
MSAGRNGEVMGFTVINGKNRIIILLIAVTILMGSGPAFPQFQGADSKELCCYIIFFPIIYPIDRVRRWYGKGIATYKIGKNTIRFERRSVHSHIDDPSRIGFGELLENTELFVGDRKVAFRRYSYVHFHLNGAVKKGDLLAETDFIIMGASVKIAPGRITFFDDGSFECGTLGESLFFTVDGKKGGHAGLTPICIEKRAAGPGR